MSQKVTLSGKIRPDLMTDFTLLAERMGKSKSALLAETVAEKVTNVDVSVSDGVQINENVLKAVGGAAIGIMSYKVLKSMLDKHNTRFTSFQNDMLAIAGASAITGLFFMLLSKGRK